MSRVVVEMTADEAKLHQALMSALSDFDKFEGGVKKTSAASRAATKDEEVLGRAAKQVYEATRTPMEQHQARMQRLAEMVQKGKMDQETYGRAASDSYAKMESALGRTGDAAKKTGEKLEQAANTGGAAFGGQALANVKAFAVELVGIGTATALVLGSLEKMRQAKEEAANEAHQAEFGIGSLKTMAKSQEEYTKLVEAAREMYAGGGASSMDEAARNVFAISSAGLFDQRQVFTKLKASGAIQDTANMARSVKTLITSMGAEETGTAAQVLSKSFAAAQHAPSFPQMVLPAAARAGVSAKAAGISDEEVLAATARLAEASGDEGRASTQLKALFRTLGNAKSYGKGEEPVPYSDEEFERDKEALNKEREAARQELRHAVKQDPEYLRRMHELDVEKARLSRAPSGRRAANPEEIANRAARARELQDEEQKALEAAEKRVEASPEYRDREGQFKAREDAMIGKKKAAGAGLSTDDEGNIIDDDRKKLLHAAGKAILTAGPDLLSQLKAIQKMGMDDAKLRKLFGRQEGLDAMRVLTSKEQEPEYQATLTDVRRAQSEDYVTKAMNFHDPSQAAAGQARKQKAAEMVSAEPLGTEANLLEAARSHYYARIRKGEVSTMYPAEANIGIHKTAWETFGRIPGAKAWDIQTKIQNRVFEDDPELYAALVKQFGGEEAVFGRDEQQHGYDWRDRVVTHQRYRKMMGLPVAAGYEEDVANMQTISNSDASQSKQASGSRARDPEHQLRARADALFGRAAQTLRGIGNTRLASEVDAARDDMSGEQFTTLADRIQKQADALQDRHLENADAVKAAVTEGRPIEPQYRNPSAGELESVKTLTELVALTRELVAEMKRANAESAKPKSRPTLSAPDRDR